MPQASPKSKSHHDHDYPTLTRTNTQSLKVPLLCICVQICLQSPKFTPNGVILSLKTLPWKCFGCSPGSSCVTYLCHYVTAIILAKKPRKKTKQLLPYYVLFVEFFYKMISFCQITFVSTTIMNPTCLILAWCIGINIYSICIVFDCR